MKLAKLREIAQHKNKFSGGHSFWRVMQDHVDALLDVVEAANNLLSKGADHPTLPMLDLGSAVCKLEAVE